MYVQVLLLTPLQTHNRRTLTHAVSWKTYVLRGCWEIFKIKVCFLRFSSIPIEQTLQIVQRELEHLAWHALLMERVAGGTDAGLCKITIYLLFWILFELGWKDQEAQYASRHTLTPFFSFHVLVSDVSVSWCSVYTSVLPGAFWDSNMLWETGKYFPKDMHAQSRKHQLPSIHLYIKSLTLWRWEIFWIGDGWELILAFCKIHLKLYKCDICDLKDL